MFYVYLYLDPRKNHPTYGSEPFYVGKGKGRRDQVHLSMVDKDKSNLHKTNRIKAIIKETTKNPIIVRIQENLTEEEAYSLEMKIISELGRVDLGTGCLLNLSDGGDGCRNISENGRMILSEKMKGDKNPNRNGIHSRGKKRPHMKGENNFFFGKTWSDADRERLSKLRIADWQINRKKYCKLYEVTSPNGDTYIVDDGLKKFAKEHNLSASALYRHALHGISPSGKTYGWSAKQR